MRAKLGHALQDSSRQRPVVKRGATIPCNLLKGVPEGWISEHLVQPWPLTTRSIKLLKSGAMADADPFGQADRAQQPWGGSKPFSGHVDGRLKRGCPWKATPALMGIPKQSHGAWNADGAKLAGSLTPGQRTTVRGQEIVGLARAWGLFSTIEHIQLPLLSIPMQQKPATSKARALRFHHGQHGLRCNEGIHCIASLHQHRVGCSRGEGMSGHNHR
jgi:hypothetical protein